MEGTSSYSPLEEVQDHKSFKQIYYPISDDEDTTDCAPYSLTKKSTRKRPHSSLGNIDEFFPEEPTKNKKVKNSSNVGRINKEGGTSYISTNIDDAANATHLLKIVVYDIKKLTKIPPSQHWKHADVRVKYYCKESHNKNYENMKKNIYQITKEISESEDCKIYSFKNYNYILNSASNSYFSQVGRALKRKRGDHNVVQNEPIHMVASSTSQEEFDSNFDNELLNICMEAETMECTTCKATIKRCI